MHSDDVLAAVLLRESTEQCCELRDMNVVHARHRIVNHPTWKRVTDQTHSKDRAIVREFCAIVRGLKRTALGCSVPQLTDHELRQMDETWLQNLP
jgi:hypothetical protein